MTRKQMSDRIQAWLGLQSIDAYNEVPLIQDMLYRGTIDLLSRTRCVVRCVDLRTQANVDQYTLDHSLITLVDVENGAMRRTRRDDPSDGFTLVRSDVLLIKPVPAADGEIQVWAVQLPQQMQADTDSPGMEQFGAIPEEFQDAIELYALWRCADYGDDGSSQAGERYRVMYEGQDGRGGRLREIRQLVNKRGTARAADRRVTLSSLADRTLWVG